MAFLGDWWRSRAEIATVNGVPHKGTMPLQRMKKKIRRHPGSLRKNFNE